MGSPGSWTRAPSLPRTLAATLPHVRGLGPERGGEKAPRPHCGSTKGSREEPARKAARGDSWCLIQGLNGEPTVPRQGAPQRRGVTGQPTRFLPRLPQMLGATSNVNFARTECKIESRLSSVCNTRTRSLPTPHPLTRGASHGSRWPGTWPGAPNCALLDGRESSGGSLYPKVLTTKAKSADPGPTQRHPAT